MSDSVTVAVFVGSGLEPGTDADGDGIADTWEYENFFNTTTVSATTDYDGDGSRDLDEYLAGTDPKDPDSALRVTALRFLPNGSLLLIWDSSTSVVPHARSYDLYAGNSVDALARGGAMIQTNLPTEGASTDFQYPAGPATQRFFRVRLHP
jgi:hypothetical protein